MSEREKLLDLAMDTACEQGKEITRLRAWAALAAGALRAAVAANGRCPVCGLYVVGDEEDRGPESMHAPGCALHEALAAAPQP